MLVFGAFLLVILDSQGAKTAEVDEAELERAKSAYESETASASQPDSPPGRRTPRIPEARARLPHKKTADSIGASSEPYTAPSPEVENEVFAEKADMKSRMNEANRLYDKADYEGSREAALAVLETSPENVRMKRIVVSSSCIMGDEDLSREHFRLLPARDQRQMARRCKRYGIDFDEEQ